MTVQNTEYYQIPTLWYLSFKGLLIEILVRSINVSKITVPPKSPQHSWQFTKSGFLEHIAQVAKYIGEYFFKLPFQESLEGSWSLQAAGMVCLLILNVGWSECLFFFFSFACLRVTLSNWTSLFTLERRGLLNFVSFRDSLRLFWFVYHPA